MTSVHEETKVGAKPDVLEVIPAPAPPADPSMLGLPVFIVGSIALGLSLTGFLAGAAAGGILPIIMFATGLGLLISTVWAISAGQTVVAAIFGIFAGFWLSYAALVLGLTHGWYAIPEENVSDTVGTFLLCWTLGVTLLTVGTLRLPLAFTVLMGLVAVALALVTIATFNTQPTIAKLGGWVVLTFAAVGVYLFMSAGSTALGGKGYPLGRALQR